MTDSYNLPEDLMRHPQLLAGFKKIAESPKFKVDLSLMDEIRRYVSIAKEASEQADKIRLPDRYETSADIHRLAAFIRRVQANRDRVIEIKIEFMPLRRSLNRLYEKFVGLLYQYDCIRKLAPAPARDATINWVLDPLRERMSLVEMIMDAASECDRNLGNAYFTLKELKAIGEIYIEEKNKTRGT